MPGRYLLAAMQFAGRHRQRSAFEPTRPGPPTLAITAPGAVRDFRLLVGCGCLPFGGQPRSTTPAGAWFWPRVKPLRGALKGCRVLGARFIGDVCRHPRPYGCNPANPHGKWCRDSWVVSSTRSRLACGHPAAGDVLFVTREACAFSVRHGRRILFHPVVAVSRGLQAILHFAACEGRVPFLVGRAGVRQLFRPCRAHQAPVTRQGMRSVPGDPRGEQCGMDRVPGYVRVRQFVSVSIASTGSTS